MAYVKTVWANGVTLFEQADMNNLETQYDEAVAVAGHGTLLLVPINASGVGVVFPSLASSYYPTVECVDAQDDNAFFPFCLPSTFVTFEKASLWMAGAGNGNAKIQIIVNSGTDGSATALITDNIAETAVAVLANTLTVYDITDAFTAVVASSCGGIMVTRFGSHGTDTVGASVHIIAIMMEYALI